MDPRARTPLSPRRQGACRRSTLRSPLPLIPTSVFPTLPTRCLQSVGAHSAAGFLALPNFFAPPSLPQQPPNTPPIWHSMATLPQAPFAAWDLAPRPPQPSREPPVPHTSHCSTPSVTCSQPPAHLQYLPRLRSSRGHSAPPL